MHAWICYIIFAVVDGRVWVYVGKTNDMTRRLRQHRGEIAGGAKETSRIRQRGGFWQLAATNWGFCSEREALVFEAQLQDPRKRRLLRDKQEDLRYMKDLPRTLYNAHLLCDTPEFSHVRVNVHSCGPHTELEYPMTKFTIHQPSTTPKPIVQTKPKSKLEERIEKYKALQEHYVSKFK